MCNFNHKNDNISIARLTVHSSNALISSVTVDSLPLKLKKGTPIKEASLNLYTGYLRRRLQVQLDHLPEERRGRNRCALYRWEGRYVRSNVIYCPTCNVYLCKKCYTKSHNTPDINRGKRAINNS